MERVGMQDLIAEVAERSGASKAATRRCLRALLGSVIEHLGAERRVTLTGFGSFTPRIVAPRRVRDPRSGVLYELPARGKVHFAAGKRMREIAEAALSEQLLLGDGGPADPDEEPFLLIDAEDEALEAEGEDETPRGAASDRHRAEAGEQADDRSGAVLMSNWDRAAADPAGSS